MGETTGPAEVPPWDGSTRPVTRTSAVGGVRWLLAAATVVLLATSVGAATGASAPSSGDQLSVGSEQSADGPTLCVDRVVKALRASVTAGPVAAGQALVNLDGTDSVEYSTFLDAVTKSDFVTLMMDHGVDYAVTAVQPKVQQLCASATTPAPGLGDATSADPCVETVLVELQKIAETGNYAAGAELIPQYGMKSREYYSYNQSQPNFVVALTRSGSSSALQQVRPLVEKLCAEGIPTVTAPADVSSSTPPAGNPQLDQPDQPGLSDVQPAEPNDCYAKMSALLRDVAEGHITQDEAESRVVDETGRERLRSAVEGEHQYEADGLSKNDAVVQATDSFTYYCPSR